MLLQFFSFFFISEIVVAETKVTDNDIDGMYLLYFDDLLSKPSLLLQYIFIYCKSYFPRPIFMLQKTVYFYILQKEKGLEGKSSKSGLNVSLESKKLTQWMKCHGFRIEAYVSDVRNDGFITYAVNSKRTSWKEATNDTV